MTTPAKRYTNPFTQMEELNKAADAYTVTLSLRAGRTIENAAVIAFDKDWICIQREDQSESYEAIANIRRIVIDAF